ncbi:hypothetical protein SDC9_158622 [bioreactor metagenome]|uniref:Uncharacterized protein n=1 Tax=bioreactor metagenome TaxID=1076179 RepID=A0A645FAJ3_9ZZZZ
MFDRDAELVAAAVHAREPVGYAGKQLYAAAFFDKALAGKRYALFAGFDHHRVHIGKDSIHAQFAAETVCGAPKIIRLHADGRDESVFLHILCAQSIIKIVHYRDYGSRHFSRLLISKKRLAEPLFVCCKSRNRGTKSNSQAGKDTAFSCEIFSRLFCSCGQT